MATDVAAVYDVYAHRLLFNKKDAPLPGQARSAAMETVVITRQTSKWESVEPEKFCLMPVEHGLWSTPLLRLLRTLIRDYIILSLVPDIQKLGIVVEVHQM